MKSAAQWSDDDDAGGFGVGLDPSPRDKLVLADSNVSSWPLYKENEYLLPTWTSTASKIM
jgi:hypothetical protein